MSQENVELVRELFPSFVEGDFDRLREGYSADAVGYAPKGWPDGEVYDGREAILRQYARLQEDWNQHDVTWTRFADHRDWVIVEMRWAGSGASSGVPVEMTLVAAYRIRGRTISEVRFFWDWDEALEAAGLSE